MDLNPYLLANEPLGAATNMPEMPILSTYQAAVTKPELYNGGKRTVSFTCILGATSVQPSAVFHPFLLDLSTAKQNTEGINGARQYL